MFYYQAGQRVDGNTQQSPQKTVYQTNLTFDIEPQIGVIPNVAFHFDIYHTAAAKFGEGDNQTAANAFFKQRKIRKAVKKPAQRQTANAAQKRHGPVCFAAPQYFNQRIAGGAEGKQL